MKILIIGATGMLAKPVIKHLNESGFVLKLFSRSIESLMFNNEFEVVKGDVFNLDELNNAVKGCDAIHITLSKTDEASAVESIVRSANINNIKMISYISGSTVAEQNRWFPMIDAKYRAEQSIINCGIPYMIFRPSWFYESLPMMIRNEKAAMIGKNPRTFSWAAAEDLGIMIANAYQKEDAKNNIFYVHGPEKYKIDDLLKAYVKHLNLENQSVKPTPIGLLKFIAFLTGNKMLKMATSLFAYFEKVDEPGDPRETNELLGKPETTFEMWIGKGLSDS